MVSQPAYLHKVTEVTDPSSMLGLSLYHHNAVIMSMMASQITSLISDCLFNHLFKVQIKENIKTPHHWPL